MTKMLDLSVHARFCDSGGRGFGGNGAALCPGLRKRLALSGSAKDKKK
jgi:hypothetical protein